MMRLYFCPECRSASAIEDVCLTCRQVRNGEALSYREKLLETLFSTDPTRVGMAVDILTTWVHEPRAIVPLLMLLKQDVDAYRYVIAARGLGWLGDQAAVPALIELLFDQRKPFVARIAAARSLGLLGSQTAIPALQLATTDELSSVARAAAKALADLSPNNENARVD
jgi:HEAT repeat protein